MADDVLMGFCTCPDAQVAGDIAEALIGEGHAACANVIPGLTSVYYWEGEVHRDPETLLVMKTSAVAWQRLQDTIQRLHPDDVPEIIAVPVDRGLPAYLEWVGEQTGGGNQG